VPEDVEHGEVIREEPKTSARKSATRQAAHCTVSGLKLFLELKFAELPERISGKFMLFGHCSAGPGVSLIARLSFPEESSDFLIAFSCQSFPSFSKDREEAFIAVVSALDVFLNCHCLRVVLGKL
jgi:hypothetical protein